MGILNRIFNKTKQDKPAVSMNEKISVEEIWTIHDVNHFIISMDDYISGKCEYGNNMDELTDAERIFYITQSLELEVNNGGFSQYFHSSNGDFAGESIQAFKEIGAEKTAEICRRALGAFGQEMPSDRDEREKMLDTFSDHKTDVILEQCDDAFYNYEDNLNELNYAFILKNKEAFV